MSELEEFKKVVSPIAYGLAYKSEFGTTEYQQLYAEEDVIKYFNNKPQLTIPQSIADLLDKFIEFDFDDVGHEDWWIQENGLIEWFSKTPNCYIKDAYLVGKALGVDLVKVVEG